MALDFLGSLGGLAGGIGQLAGPIGQILGAVKGQKSNKIVVQRPAQSEAEKYSISMLKALADPNNSLLKSMTAEEMQNLASGVQGDIREKVLADRRERAMGRAPVFFDPERADENIAYQISRGTPMLMQTARSNAIQRILDAAGVGKYASNADTRESNYLRALGEVQKGMAMQPQTNGLDRLTSGLGGLTQILSLFGQQGGGGTSNYKDGTSISWNQPLQYNQMRY